MDFGLTKKKREKCSPIFSIDLILRPITNYHRKQKYKYAKSTRNILISNQKVQLINLCFKLTLKMEKNETYNRMMKAKINYMRKKPWLVRGSSPETTDHFFFFFSTDRTRFIVDVCFGGEEVIKSLLEVWTTAGISSVCVEEAFVCVLPVNCFWNVLNLFIKSVSRVDIIYLMMGHLRTKNFF